MSSEITGILPITNGGTGASTQQDAINALTNVAGATEGQVLKKVGSNGVFADDEGTEFESGTVQTVDDTATTLLSLSIPEDSTQAIVANVSGKGPSGKHVWAIVHCGAYREGTGNATVIGTSLISTDDTGNTTYEVSVSVSGNNLLIQVQGNTSETVDWSGKAIR